MTTEQIAAALRMVRDMRSAQKKYFETRSGSVLRESKALEARVDQLLANYQNLIDTPPGETSEQKTLF